MGKYLTLLFLAISVVLTACSQSGFEKSGSKKTTSSADPGEAAPSDQVGEDDEIAENPTNITGVFLTLYTVQEPTASNPESKVGIVLLDSNGKKDTSRNYQFTTKVSDNVTGRIRVLKSDEPYHAYQIVEGANPAIVRAAVDASRITAEDSASNEKATIYGSSKKSTPREEEAPGQSDFDLPTDP